MAPGQTRPRGNNFWATYGPIRHTLTPNMGCVFFEESSRNGRDMSICMHQSSSNFIASAQTARILKPGKRKPHSKGTSQLSSVSARIGELVVICHTENATITSSKTCLKLHLEDQSESTMQVGASDYHVKTSPSQLTWNLTRSRSEIEFRMDDSMRMADRTTRNPSSMVNKHKTDAIQSAKG